VATGYGTTEWRDDLRRVLKRAGLDGRDCVFLLADTQIAQEVFLEDINNILNAGGLVVWGGGGGDIAKQGLDWFWGAESAWAYEAGDG